LAEGLAKRRYLIVVASVVTKGGVGRNILILVTAYKNDPLEKVDMLTARQLLKETRLVVCSLNIEVLDRFHLGHPSHIEKPYSHQTALNISHTQVRRANSQ